MNALWRKSPATAKDVGEMLPKGTDWAYTTVKTMLSRLAAKGAVSERKLGPSVLYEPLLTRKAARVAALKALAEDAFGGAMGALTHFLVEENRLSPQDKAALAKLIDEKAKKGGRK